MVRSDTDPGAASLILCMACILANPAVFKVLQAWPCAALISQKPVALFDKASSSHTWPLSVLLFPFESDCLAMRE